MTHIHTCTYPHTHTHAHTENTHASTTTHTETNSNFKILYNRGVSPKLHFSGHRKIILNISCPNLHYLISAHILPVKKPQRHGLPRPSSYIVQGAISISSRSIEKWSSVRAATATPPGLADSDRALNFKSTLGPKYTCTETQYSDRDIPFVRSASGQIQ